MENARASLSARSCEPSVFHGHPQRGISTAFLPSLVTQPVAAMDLLRLCPHESLFKRSNPQIPLQNLFYNSFTLCEQFQHRAVEGLTMTKHLCGVVWSLITMWSLISVGLGTVFAHSYGPPPAVTGAPGDNAKSCTLCHAGTLNSGSGSVKIIPLSGAVYIPRVRQRIMVQVSDPNQQRWGFQLTARLNSDPQNSSAGDLVPIDNLTQVICGDAGAKPCTGVSFIEHTSAGTRNGLKNGAIFQFDWNPPATNAGAVTLYVAGNAANGNSAPTGDFIYTSSLQLDPATPLAPVVPAGNIVSSATSAAGPMGPYSWVTAYGSNLSATTRGWTDSDFINGGMPLSLDGVSVVLTYFGAPRLAAIGYVSPTQVNFLLPSDTSPTTVQVQIRNPAGITTQLPITVLASAPQFLTSDGKHALGSHADGTSLTATPAAPGETILLYATGCGATNPALVPGQLPTQASPLATLPQATIGGASATVASITALVGVAGVYQINVRVPATTASGDQAVVLQSGTFSSSAALVAVGK